MFTTLVLLLALIAGITALSLLWSAARPSHRFVGECPQLPPVRELPVSRLVWAEVEEPADYDRAAWDRQIDHMIKTTARWQRYQARGRVA